MEPAEMKVIISARVMAGTEINQPELEFSSVARMQYVGVAFGLNHNQIARWTWVLPDIHKPP